jgi:DNA-directed RNA polymerase subunit H (RpoH/RPB5)
MNAGAAVPLPALLKRRVHQEAKPTVLDRMGRLRTTLPRIKTAAPHAQAPTEEADRVVRLLRGDEPEPHRLCFAKKAAAFLGSPAPLEERDALSAAA